MKIIIRNQAVWVNYHHLYCFYCIAKEGGLSAASQSLSIGQSALSIQMKQFEETLGFQLFTRSHKKLDLNENGKTVFNYAKDIFRLGSEMVESLHDHPSPYRLHLQVGAQDSIPKHIVADLAMRVLKRKDCNISILEGKLDELLKNLEQHRIDLVIANHAPLGNLKQFYSKRVATLPLCVVGTKKFKYLRKGFPHSLDRVPMVLPTSESKTRHEFDAFCELHGISPDICVEAQDVMVQKLLAIKGAGVTLVSEFAVKEYLDNQQLIKLGEINSFSEDLYLISAHRTKKHPVSMELMKEFEINSKN